MVGNDTQRRAPLPVAVRDLALRLGVDPGPDRATIRLTQRGRIRRSLDADRWMDFAATQSMATRECAFDWRAHAGPFGLVTARDALIEGEGRFDVTALGLIALVRAPRTAALVRGELMRYLAELAWAPDAILLNTALRWREAATDAFVVAAGEGATGAEVELTLDGDGRIAGAFAPDRPRAVGAETLPTPWRGRFTDYRLHDGRWLPFAGAVAWEIAGRETPYFEARLESWAAQPTAVAGAAAPGRSPC